MNLLKKTIENIFAFMLGITGVVLCLVAVIFTFFVFLVYMILPITISIRNGWNIRFKLNQFKEEFLNVVSLFRFRQ